ncbi:hypothetical protein HPB52_000434 [Rhipicephalus sanguineus]|uniref:Uncharacterized protein n=1 Tax=Rhipicephalus sanguineus TaxID=34632 RepID=A0A9D4SNI8_RHISA|nr:hypothetical protein HPB52_000434 [Rhipicephalus sanguineus]
MAPQPFSVEAAWTFAAAAPNIAPPMCWRDLIPAGPVTTSRASITSSTVLPSGELKVKQCALGGSAAKAITLSVLALAPTAYAVVPGRWVSMNAWTQPGVLPVVFIVVLVFQRLGSTGYFTRSKEGDSQDFYSIYPVDPIGKLFVKIPYQKGGIIVEQKRIKGMKKLGGIRPLSRSVDYECSYTPAMKIEVHS